MPSKNQVSSLIVAESFNNVPISTIMVPIPMRNFVPTGPTQALQDLLVTSSTEIAAILAQLRDQGTQINLTSPHEVSFSSLLWAVDPLTETVSFKVAADQPFLQPFVDTDEATASAYLDQVKIQFELQDLMLVRSPQGCALHGRFPAQILRFQRRSTDRIQPLSRTLSRAFLRHPMLAEMQLELRILDISAGGVAVFLPDNIPVIDPGILINEVQFVLDTNTRFTASIFLRHISSIGPACGGLRLGCEIMNLDAESLMVLQGYIDQNQQQRGPGPVIP
ncbi:MAG: flagellar brake protein [Burkholderiales bacterium]|jgi:c-di-GMP-binding flagellar brake protein YcgR